jgi:drug/metabolite transporter (DMT)-like permease
MKKNLIWGVVFIFVGICMGLFFFGGYLFDSVPVRDFGHTRGNSIVAIGFATLSSFGFGVYLLLCEFLRKKPR